MATNWSGPRRYGHGTIRDYVIGIHAVDGRGMAFKGGGRVVKNVAGYDFCKLLTGSLGTLGVITQLALKVKPLPESAATVVADVCRSRDRRECCSIGSPMLEAPPVAIDLLGRRQAGRNRIRKPKSQTSHRVRVEGTEAEIGWLADQIQYRALAAAGGTSVACFCRNRADALWNRQIEFADRGAERIRTTTRRWS